MLTQQNEFLNRPVILFVGTNDRLVSVHAMFREYALRLISDAQFP